MISHNHLVFASLLSFIFVSSVSALPRIFPNASSIPPSFIPNATHGAWEGYKNFTGCQPGERKDGLAKIKDYFTYFGYINKNSSHNFTDEFDEDLESAIKTYQKNFKLNVTGWLDEPTMSQIVRPRCGVADIINGTNTMNSGKKTTSHFHTVAHYTYFDGEPKWTKNDLTYAFLPDNNLSDTVRAVFQRAFDRWAEVIPMNFTEIDSYVKADIRVGFFTGDHGDGEAFDGALGTLGHSFSPPSGIFHLDGAENWVLDVSSTKSSSAVDLESVAVHEIGHVLGLGHTDVDEAIMYPTLSADTRKVELASDDIEGVQNLYGSNPNYNGSTTTESQGKDTNGGRSYFIHSIWDLRVISVVFVLFML